MAERPLVTTTEAARLLGVSTRTLQQWRTDGTVLPDLEVARIDHDAVARGRG